MSDEQVLVVGGGLAAAKLVDGYREAGGQEVVTILSAEPDLPYHRPPLSKGFLREEVDAAATLVHPAAFYEENVVDVRLGTTVVAVHPDAREVELESGEHVPYGTLVVATGARPRTLDVPGIDLIGVHTFRTLADATTVRDARDAHRTLVVGASFIGCEVAASMRALGREVAVVDPLGVVMPKLRCPELSEQIAGLARSKGVELLLGEELAELRGNGRLLVGGLTGSGRALEAYLAVVGIGVVPNVELLAEAGAAVDEGVVVDGRFETSLPGTYAIGDVARFPEPTSGEPRRIEHWSNAAAHGTYLGRLLAGGDGAEAKPFTEVPTFFTQVFGLKLQVIGDLQGAIDTCTLSGSAEEGRLIAFHLAEGVVVGGILAGQAADVAEELKRLVRDRVHVDDPDELSADSTRLHALS